MVHNLPLYILPTLLIAAALGDLMSLRIPNWLTLLTAGLFFPTALLLQMPLAEFGSHILAGVLLFIIGYLLFTFGIFGGGDGKLMAAAGLWFGVSKIVPFLLFTAFAGGVLAVAVIAWSVVMMSWEIEGDTAPFAGFAKKLRTMTPSVPYGVALAVGGILAFKDTWWLNGMV